MKVFVITILACALMIEAAPFGVDQVEDGFNNFGEDLQNGASELGLNGNPLEQGADFINDGIGRFGLGGQSRSSQYNRGRNQKGYNYNHGANGASDREAHNAGANEFHNVGQHHNKVTSVTQNESDDSHNIGGSSSHNVGSHSGGRFHKQANGAGEAGNDFAQGNEQSDIIA